MLVLKQVDVIQVGGILRSLGFVTELAEVQAWQIAGRIRAFTAMPGAAEDCGLEPRLEQPTVQINCACASR